MPVLEDDGDERPALIAEFERYVARNGVPRERYPQAMLAFLREYCESPDIMMERLPSRAKRAACDRRNRIGIARRLRRYKR